MGFALFLVQSKLLWFSLFSLSISLLALQASLSNQCTSNEPQPSDQSQLPLFSYPSTYGAHKYAIPTVRSTCNSSLIFQDYGSVLKEIQDIVRNRRSCSSLRYVSGPGVSFAGNLSSAERNYYFDHNNDQVEVPCGFMKDFPIQNSDKLAMENCKGVVIVSAIFGNHDKIRQPRGLKSETSEIACFFMFIDDRTLKGLNSHNMFMNKTGENKIGAWKMVLVSGELPYNNPAMNGVIPKHLTHRLFPNALYSIWVDAKLQLTVDPLLLLHSLVVRENRDMAISMHPYNVHTMEEAVATARWKKWGDIGSLREQMETYCDNGLRPWTTKKLPYTTDVPDSALILRKHSVGSSLFSCLLFNELEAFNPRDQLGFAYVRDLMKPTIDINMFQNEIFEQVAMEYRHNIKKGSAQVLGGQKTKMADAWGGDMGRCQGYLLEMWGSITNHWS
ncbi:hypothetical protein AMTRI_Chr03g141940 [Amborella trichopoda]|uniref:TOD1/MUCI70 glycosyltransferase-like domain-containing protein n=1 Tax=Amborella trichopoda TaxID=13333 RepID=W1P649_AMBTC|nr:uncharacterized protein LOC18430556 [Amborella trichopoda]ERN02445.1 hypothetical protein AMTR_s00096p00166410 [Amborella trichopoda]|eukprot:XP_006840770.1 uncharacterized protein LOC18430556 [Amborella trichopoda]